ncbi:MAG: restriction endonuclease subunit S [Christensenellales bacterium]
MSKEKTPEYCIPCYGGNGLRGYVREANQQGDKPLIGRQGALCGNVCFAKGDYYATEHAVVVTDQGFYNSRFLYHLLVNKNLNQYKTSGAQPGLSVAKLETILLPVPEIEIQKRIADVLDNFDAICSDLNIGLPAEIEARKKQYEFYRDQLLTFAAQDEIVLTDRQTDRQTDEYNALIRLCQYVFGYISIELGSIGKVSMCKRIMKAETAPNGDVPFYKIGTFGKTPDAYISREKFEEYRKAYSFPKKGDVLISAAGTIGRTVIYDGEDAYYQDSNIVWVDNDESIVLNRYLFYCYQLQPWAVSEGGTIARLYNDNISKAKIKVPSIAEQKRIIAILDHFSTLCTDLTSGLPAEIEARQKQYEYYRDNLLSFTPAD